MGTLTHGMEDSVFEMLEVLPLHIQVYQNVEGTVITRHNVSLLT